MDAIQNGSVQPVVTVAKTTHKRGPYTSRMDLADELEELQMTGAELARELHVPSSRIYQLIAGRRAMTADTALRLEQWLGVEAAFWMNLQKRYELDLAAEQPGEEIQRTVTAASHPPRCSRRRFNAPPLR